MVQTQALNGQVCRVTADEVRACEGRYSGIIAKGQAGLNAIGSINGGKVAEARIEGVSSGGADSEMSAKPRGNSDLREKGRGSTGSRLLEHNAVERAGACGQGGGDCGALGCLRAAARNEGLWGLGGAGAVEDVVHDGHSGACIHQRGAGGRAGIHVAEM